MVFHKLFVRNKSGKTKKVRLKSESKLSLDELREFIKFPIGWRITSVAYLTGRK